MSSDLGLDPSDPLNLLLHNTAQNGPSSSAIGDTPSQSENTALSDWSQLTALWNNSEPDNSAMKPIYSDMLQCQGSSSTEHFAELSMNMDIHSFGIEPNMLHFDDPSGYQQPFNDIHYPYFPTSPGDVLSNQFPFSFQAALDQIPPESLSSSSPSSISSRSPSISSGSPQPPSPDTRRLSVTSTPVTPKTQINSQTTTTSMPVSPPVPRTAQNTAEDLAQRVRQTAGVMLAVPMMAQLTSHATTGIPVPSTPVQAKLPIPRLPRHYSRSQVKVPSPGSSSYGGSSSADSTPPPSTPPPPPPASSVDRLVTTAPSGANVQLQAIAPQGGAVTSVSPASTSQAPCRPKTSHTTIERRYRTNLNARIQSLRMAVPALRVLEDRDSSDGKKIKRALKGGIVVQGVPGATGIVTPGEGGTVIDVIDERGYVDGVKIARKCSKANVLGKAVEYIKVLKRREHRLKAEQAGLKTLISGLVGGTALLREWEKEWKERFGGEERDELDADELANNEVEDEDSDEDDEDEEGETGRKRKRGKLALSGGSNGAGKRDKNSQPVAAQPTNGPGESAAPDAPVKRKRGRPRKAPLPVPPISTSSNIAPQRSPVTMDQDVNMLVTPQQQPYQNTGAHSQPQQYLLATFALFSFFNSPLTSSYPPSRQHGHHRAGVVLNPHPPLAYAPEIVAGLSGAAEHQAPHLGGTHNARSWGSSEYAQAFQLVVSVLVLFSMVMSWLRVGTIRGESRSWLFSILRAKSSVLETRPRSSDGHENSNWIKIGGQLILKESPTEPRTMSLYACMQVYRAVISISSAASIGDLCTLSLVLHGAGPSVVNALLRMRSRAVWDQAKMQCASLLRKPGKHVSVYERLVLETMDADEAASRISDVNVGQVGLDMSQAPSPLQALGGALVRDRMKKYLGSAFVKLVDGQTEDDKLALGDDDEEDRQRTFSAAAELGGRLAELGKMTGRLCQLIAGDSGRMVMVSPDLVESLASSNEDDEVASLILSLVLYQRVFHSREKGQWTMLSPPPSPGRAVRDPVFLLKKTLGSRVFEEGSVEGLEEARDSAVDLVVEIERMRRR
ncbi:hypothetical protein AX15_004733 [Amanita polypyramis BW_CC]|nr:hypothetical protein AX15_004733 [Amanita polypyramis BW_CC]